LTAGGLDIRLAEPQALQPVQSQTIA